MVRSQPLQHAVSDPLVAHVWLREERLPCAFRWQIPAFSRLPPGQKTSEARSRVLCYDRVEADAVQLMCTRIFEAVAVEDRPPTERDTGDQAGTILSVQPR